MFPASIYARAGNGWSLVRRSSATTAGAYVAAHTAELTEFGGRPFTFDHRGFLSA